MRSIPATAFSPRIPSSREPARPPASSSSARRRRPWRLLGNKVSRARARRSGRGGGDAGDRSRCPRMRPGVRALAARHRLPGDAEGELGRGRPRHARGASARRSSPSCSPLARREALAAFGNDEVYLEKLVRRARHVEVQILGDAHGTLVHLFERDCTVQRRNQKVVERAPAVFLQRGGARPRCARRRSPSPRGAPTRTPARWSSCRTPTAAAATSSRSTRASRSSTRSPKWSPASTSSRRRSASPAARASARPRAACRRRSEIRIAAHALQCRITTEDPENDFIPDYGKISAYRSPAGFGIRLDAGTAYTGAIITRSYDSLLVKVTAWSPTPEETIARMHRALAEFRIRGVVTNLRFLDQLITHPRFARGDYTTRFIEETPELLRWPRKRDRATRILTFIGDTIVNGNAESQGPRRARPRLRAPRLPAVALPPPAPGTKQKLEELGPERFAQLDARAGARAPHRHQHARCAPVTASRRGCARVDMAAIAPYYASAAAAAVLGGVLGRGDLRRGAALPARGPLAAPGARCASACRTCCCRCCCARPTRSATPTTRTTWCASSCSAPRPPASTCSASSTRSTGSRTCASRSTRCSKAASCARRRCATRAT